MKRLVLLACLGWSVLTVALHAQAVDVSIEMIPTNPQPGETVTLTAQSYGADINQSSLTWTYNGKVIASGTGKSSVSVIAPASGATGTITVTASGAGLESGSDTVILRPGSIDLLWEAIDAYTPPFYKGKALMPVGGAVRLTAIPNPSTPKNLSYNWSKNGSALTTVSGYNKSSIAIRHSAFDQTTKISVNAQSGTYSATASTALTPTDPQAVLYKVTSGFIDHTKGYDSTVPFTEPGAILRVEPYYFSLVKNTLADLSFETTIDGSPFTSDIPNEFALTRPELGGQSKLTVAITTLVYSLQNLTKTFTLVF